MATPPPPSLAERITEVLRSAAFSCDGHCGLTERDCYAQHPIQVAAWHHGEVGSVYGDIPALATVAATAVQPQLDAARRSARASEESTVILQRAWDAQAAEWDVARVERDEARRQLAAVAAQRDELRAELDAARADLAAMTDLRDRAIARQDHLRAKLAAARALLPADPAEDINASWLPPRYLRAALEG